MSSSEEVELGVLFLNTKTAVPMRNKFKYLGHTQLGNPIQMVNKTAGVLINSKSLPRPPNQPT